MGRMFLAMNGKRINSLDDLRANFNPDQMLSFYRSGRLQKWLEECGATEELENINSIESGYDDATLLSMLMAVFELSDEQMANVQRQRRESEEGKQEGHSATPVAECSPIVVADKEDTPAMSCIQNEAPCGETPQITWKLCGFPAIGQLNEIVSKSTLFEDVPPKSRALKSGDIGFSHFFFAKGYFWCFVVEKKSESVLLLRSENALDWEVISEKLSGLKKTNTKTGEVKQHIFLAEVSNAKIIDSAILFQKDGMQIMFLDDIRLGISDCIEIERMSSFPEYIRTENGNWERIEGITRNDSYGRVFVAGDKIFLCGDCSGNLECVCINNGEWVRSSIPKIGCRISSRGRSYEDFSIAKSNDWYFLSKEDVNSLLFYSSDGLEWKQYEDKSWQKIVKIIAPNTMLLGNERILLFSPEDQSYILGEIQR